MPFSLRFDGTGIPDFIKRAAAEIIDALEPACPAISRTPIKAQDKEGQAKMRLTIELLTKSVINTVQGIFGQEKRRPVASDLVFYQLLQI